MNGGIEHFVSNPFDVTGNNEHALEFNLRLSRFSGLSEFGISVYG
jgi:hypothetical protein